MNCKQTFIIRNSVKETSREQNDTDTDHMLRLSQTTFTTRNRQAAYSPCNLLQVAGIEDLDFPARSSDLWPIENTFEIAWAEGRTLQ